MIKKYKIFNILILLLLVLISGCSTYSAVGLVELQTNNGYEISFLSLEGTLNKKLYKTDKDTAINYNCKLEIGEVNIYYKTSLENNKTLICNIKAGEELSGFSGYVNQGDRATIIIETVKKSKGSFNFSYN